MSSPAVPNTESLTFSGADGAWQWNEVVAHLTCFGLAMEISIVTT